MLSILFCFSFAVEKPSLSDLEDVHSDHIAVNTELVPASSRLMAPGKCALSKQFPAFLQEKSLC